MPSTVTPGIAYPAARIAYRSIAICRDKGTEIAYLLFSTKKTTGNLWMDAKFIASCTSPWLVVPSPKKQPTTALSPRIFTPSAQPTAWGTCVPITLEWLMNRNSGAAPCCGN